MPEFKATVPHDLGKEAAKSKLESFVARLREKYPDQVNEATANWSGDELQFGFTSFGIKITGTITVEPQQVTVHGQIPFAATMFKGKIVDSVTQGLERALSWTGPRDGPQ